MWFAAGILGIIAIATGITLLPNGSPPQPSTASAAASPSRSASTDPGQR